MQVSWRKEPKEKPVEVSGAGESQCVEVDEEVEREVRVKAVAWAELEAWMTWSLSEAWALEVRVEEEVP